MSEPAVAGSGSARRSGSPPVGPLVLVVDDEPAMQRLLMAVLVDHGFRTVQAASGAEAVTLASTCNPDLVLLDLGLPDFDGMEVTRRLRQWYSAPILVLSARGQENDKIEALDVGANDYVTKPFAAGELLARLRVWLRQAALTGGESDDSFIDVGDLRIDLARRLVFVGQREVHLTPTEYKLFSMLMRNAGRVITHRQLLEEAWGPPYANETQYLRVYMANLRQKLEKDSARPRYLLNEPGVGYRLRAP
jgi:two-component system, OmpR family, KDP operon response regulator KdpE